MANTGYLMRCVLNVFILASEKPNRDDLLSSIEQKLKEAFDRLRRQPDQ